MRIGITGHRPNRLRLPGDVIERRIQEALLALVGTGLPRTRAGKHVAVSPLAEGADRIFAEAALALRLSLEVILPMPSDAYETTFADASDSPRYRALLRQSSSMRTLPGNLSDTKSAFEAVGRAVVVDSDALVAVWDGKGAAGRGGTPEVIAFALAQDRPVVWVDAASDRPPQRLVRIEPATEIAPLLPQSPRTPRARAKAGKKRSASSAKAGSL